MSGEQFFIFWVLYTVVYLLWRAKQIRKLRVFIKEISPRNAGRLNNGYIAFGENWGFSAKYASENDKAKIDRQANIVRDRLMLFHPYLLALILLISAFGWNGFYFVALGIIIHMANWWFHRN